MRVWLIAREALWDKLQQEQVLYYDSQSMPNFYLHAYEWMCKQMKNRLPLYQGNFPWWAWAQWEAGKLMPDLRSRDNELYVSSQDELAVRLELELANEDVLCSDFTGWCMVIANEYVAKTQEAENAWNQLAPHAQTQQRLAQSWEAIFDLDDRHWYIEWKSYNPKRIQAVFEELRLQDVKKVTHFLSRHRKGDENSFYI